VPCISKIDKNKALTSPHKNSQKKKAEKALNLIRCIILSKESIGDPRLLPQDASLRQKRKWNPQFLRLV